jgi:hypothetical protein
MTVPHKGDRFDIVVDGRALAPGEKFPCGECGAVFEFALDSSGCGAVIMNAVSGEVQVLCPPCDEALRYAALPRQ